MKRKRALIIVILVLMAATCLFMWINRHQPYSQIERAVAGIDSDFNQLLHVHLDREKTIAFYTTHKEELGIITLQENFGRFKFKDYINKSLLYTDKDISWHGTENNKENIHLLYGTVQNPDISQVVILSEGNKSAFIINKDNRIIWYALMDEQLKLPITIRTTNRDGKIIYETGDVKYWNK
ncbi:hypothetical protein [Paenibacillus puerhi]|uniref:hypothetical protein n=1 Tax=Paenibacillus puerhi TaxID=2692622 RepID=UPI00135C0912|nr:hypothetical protein [Paenibacillus puerhi]